MKRRAKLYENITSLKKTAQIDGELLAFVDMLQSLRSNVHEYSIFTLTVDNSNLTCV
jgi:transcriptional regulator of NAD metabolism